MDLTVQSVNFDADIKLKDFIQDKSSKLLQFYDGITTVDVYLRVEKNHQKGNKLVEMKVNVPGSTLMASQRNTTFEAATDKLIDQMSRQVKRYKAKQKAA